jgi:Domain of unknown function (DUF4082)
MPRWAMSFLLSLSFFALTSGCEALAQTVSIFGNTAPSAGEGWNTPMTLGVKFWSTEAGTVSAIQFYRHTTSPQGYVASLYSASGTLLGSVTMATESGPVPGWQVGAFASPIPISPNTSYVAAYYVPSGEYTQVPQGLAQGVTTGPLNAPASSAVGGNGVYHSKLAFPTHTWENANYSADVVFTPAAPKPYLTVSFNPANPTVASNAPAGTVVATVTASWSDGSPFTGSLSFGSPNSNDKATFAISGNQLIVNPDGPGLSADGGTDQLVTIVATQQ